ncbi:Hypp4011 [Branchiostoma lanceolatum]|uniref:Hypp4011 protein n=1 Tax=Branchiostoma lanceolatum TaxID=7740 RepID=A0A8K0A4B8_BRALA|nr:Hypp4011 [Branchiostoma lanceolatum]
MHILAKVLIDDLRELKLAYESSILARPEDLVPGIPDSGDQNGLAWDSRDPTEEGWLCEETVTVYTTQCSFRQTNADGEPKDTKEAEQRVVSDPYKKFFSELAMDTPLCGILQMDKTETEGSTMAIVRSVVQNRPDIFDSAMTHCWKD